MPTVLLVVTTDGFANGYIFLRKKSGMLCALNIMETVSYGNVQSSRFFLTHVLGESIRDVDSILFTKNNMMLS